MLCFIKRSLLFLFWQGFQLFSSRKLSIVWPKFRQPTKRSALFAKDLQPLHTAWSSNSHWDIGIGTLFKLRRGGLALRRSFLFRGCRTVALCSCLSLICRMRSQYSLRDSMLDSPKGSDHDSHGRPHIQTHR